MTFRESMSNSDCQSTRTFADLRSASLEQQRTQNRLKRYNKFRSLSPIDLPSHPNQQSHYLPSCASPSCPLYKSTYGTCAHWDQTSFPADLSSAPVSKFTQHGAYIEAQRSIPVHSHHSRKRRSNRNKRTWRKALGRRTDAHLAIAQYQYEMEYIYGRIDVKQDEEWIEDITYREWEGGNWSEWCMQQGAGWEDVQSWEPWKEVGETFSMWAQRRINEMRQVKEDRLRAKLATSASSTLKGAGRKMALTTTLPTIPSDIEAHAKLEHVLRLSWRRKWEKFSVIHGYDWFDEYVWYWHRNMSGCFELSSWTEHFDHAYSRCYCDLYAPCGWWDPEDKVQSYALEEFIVSSCENGVDLEGQREEDNIMHEDVTNMHTEVVRVHGIVNDAYEKVESARKEIYEEGIGREQEIEDVYGRMAEVYGEIQRLQLGLNKLNENYKAVYEEMKACSTVEEEKEDNDADKDKGVDEHDAGESEEDAWDVVSLIASLPPLSSSSSWSMVEPENQTEIMRCT